MGSKVVVLIISIILVVGVVIGVVAVVHHQKQKVDYGNKDDESLSLSMKTVNALCSRSSFKDECIKSLGSVAQNQTATPHDFVNAGIRMSLQEIMKANDLTDTLVPKVNATKNPERSRMAIESCKNLFNLAIDRLNGTIERVEDSKIYEHKDLVWNVRLWLSDVVTFSTSCVDEFDEAEAPELQKTMQDGVLNATQLTINLVDIITTFNEALGDLDLSLNATKLNELSANVNCTVNTFSSSRRLLGIAIDGEGYPTWLSATDRRLLGAKHGKKRIHRKRGKGKGKKKGKKGKDKKGVIVGGAIGAVTAPRIAPGMRPNAVVAQDGSGQFKSIVDALKAHPGRNIQGRYVIYVKAGIYREDVWIGKEQPNVFMYGDGPTRTVVTGSKSFAKGFQTSKTAPFNVEGMGFFGKDMGFQNTAGPSGHQAVALRVNALQAVFHNCWFDGFQDTLYVQGGSQFFRDCQIAGTIDFIFGNGATLIQNSRILAKKCDPNQMNLLTAQGGVSANEPTGIVIQGCEVLPDRELFPLRFKLKTYLGRPWKPYAKTLFLENMMGDLIQPAGYEPWAGNANIGTAFYGEYANRGPGANTAMRVKWKSVRVLDKAQAQRYSAGVFLAGAPWVRAVGVPLNLNLA
ncbi:probable pectinesterase/pectinesterase inhibitor [Amaranthus tricolor]|uniref:probable pectinesterase/pectinesterase inhibitor n=1 Tax=Amaranthus tricolor TaxID=29722 RepID=UPI002587A38B|nr:probable pectinesterase/pectinesterase inhibitor [Amaranthus tricolor]